MMEAALSDSNHSDAEPLLDWDDERAAELWRLRRKKEEKKVEEENELNVTSLLLYVSRSWA
jgi:hypothetical protein